MLHTSELVIGDELQKEETTLVLALKRTISCRIRYRCMQRYDPENGLP
jgi:hypothetical protein